MQFFDSNQNMPKTLGMLPRIPKFLPTTESASEPLSLQMVDAASKQLLDEGFFELKEGRRWAEVGVLQKGGKYFYSREGSTLVAFTVGGEFEPGL